jgi:hypothetical protein
MLNWSLIQEPILEKDARQLTQVAWRTGLMILPETTLSVDKAYYL